MEKYSEYKATGSQWFESVPLSWNYISINKVSEIILGKMLQGEPKKPTDVLTKYICAKDVHFDGVDTSALKEMYFGEDELDSYCVQRGDMLIVEGGAGAGNCSIVKKELEDVGVQNSVMIVRAGQLADNSYICYCLSDLVHKGYIESVTHVATIPHFTKEKVGRTYIPVPPLSEQQAIVSYLDDKCGKIDQLLENKEKEIALLTEMKQRVIADAVTKGLNPDVTMKDSGIMWIPEIPGHWSSNRVKHLFTHHKIIAKEKSTEYERLALTMAGVIKRDKEDGTGLQPDNFDTYQVVFNNDIIFKLIDLNNISTSRVGLSPYIGIVSPAYIVISPKEGVYTKFFEYYFKDMWHRCIFNALGDNGVRSSLSTSDVLSLPIPVPPIEEQKAIVAHIEEKVSKIDALAEKLQKEIESIKEYKQRLISDVVTGQIKVC